MADPKVHTNDEPGIEKADPAVSATSADGDPERQYSISEKGWIYRPFKLGTNKVWYASPAIQLGLVAFVCFLCPGMFNAINGMGAGGQVDPTTANNANTALYSTFSVLGFVAGSIVNRLGIRLVLMFSGVGYVLYVASFLSFNHNANEGFVIFAGALLGLCAGCLWAAQGAIMMSYPLERHKGKYIAWFWGIFNMGGVIGSLVGDPCSL
jgi:MFS family permease